MSIYCILAFESLKIRFLASYAIVCGGYLVFSRLYNFLIFEKKGLLSLSNGLRTLRNSGAAYIDSKNSNILLRSVFLRFLLFLKRLNKLSFLRIIFFTEAMYNFIAVFFAFVFKVENHQVFFTNIRSSAYYSFYGFVIKFLNRLRIFNSLTMLMKFGRLSVLPDSLFFRRFDHFF